MLGALMGLFLLPGGAVATTTPVSVVPSYTVTLTAYNAVPDQTDNSPLVTASGAYSNPEVIAARSQDLADELPFGTIIEIDGSNTLSGNTCGYNIVAPQIGYRVIEDTMNARYTDRVDVLFYTKGAAQVLGVCKGVTIRVVGHVDFNHIPKTQTDLAALVTGGSGLAVK